MPTVGEIARCDAYMTRDDLVSGEVRRPDGRLMISLRALVECHPTPLLPGPVWPRGVMYCRDRETAAVAPRPRLGHHQFRRTTPDEYGPHSLFGGGPDGRSRSSPHGSGFPTLTADHVTLDAIRPG